MAALYTDLRFGLRLLRGNPAFTAVVVLTLALGIAATTTVFSWIDGLLLRPFPGAAGSEQLAVLETVAAGTPDGASRTSYLDYRDYRDGLKLIAGLAAHSESVFSLGDAESGQAVWGELVSGNYFAVLGVRPALGRVFTPQEYDDKPGAHPVAVISHRLWRSRFQADPAVVGKTVRVNRRELTVAGVAPPEFRGTVPGLAFDIWIPLSMGAELGIAGESAFRHRGSRNFYVIARLKPGVTIAQARTEAAALARNLAAIAPDTNRGLGATILPPWKAAAGAGKLLIGPLQILMAVSVVVLLIVCANVANLLLARSVSRQKEFGVRIALGAGGLRLARQLLTETLLLAGGGALAGLPLAAWMAESLPALVPNVGVSVAAGFELNSRILGFMMLVSASAALVSGAAPALVALRSNVNEILKEGGRSGRSGAHSHRTRGLLVISEVALAAVALISAGLFVQSFQNTRTMHPGFDRNNVLLAKFYLASAGYRAPEAEQFCLRLRERLRTLPGVTEVSYADYAPLGSTSGPYHDVSVQGYAPGPGEQMTTGRTLVAPGYFSLLRIPLREGRDFTENDDLKAPPVMIVSEAFARRYFAGTNAIGRKVRAWGRWFTVAGVAKDSRHFDWAEAPRPHFYAPLLQRHSSGLEAYFFIRTAGDPRQAIAALRREVAAIDPNAGAFHAMPLTEWTGVTLLPQKVAASLLAVLGLISLTLAAVGLYSVMAYTVSQRTHEIGIRMALGARPRDVLGGVLRLGMALTGAGLAAGVVAALALTRLAAGMLLNVHAADFGTFAAVALFLGSIALAASYVPARRATKVEPMVALRWE